MVSSNTKGFSPKIWAPGLWFFLHIVSINYPTQPTQEDRRNYRSFLKNLGRVLPCRMCRSHFPENFVKAGGNKEKSYENRKNFSKFIYKLHKCINNGDFGISYTDLINKYEKYRENKKQVRTSVAVCPIQLAPFFE